MSIALEPPGSRSAATVMGVETTTRLPVSVVIPVRNEERNLPVCLQRLAAFAEVIVVDSGSTDRTVAIAEAAGARVVQFVWNGRYPKKRNHVLLTERFVAPWVLFLDADERVTDDFVIELAGTLKATPHAGFWLEYQNFFKGRVLMHGVPQRKLALFRVGAGLYERIDETAWSGLDMEVHEHPVLEGSVGEISARLEHRDCDAMETRVERHREYASWEAARYHALHAGSFRNATHLTARQRFKYRHLGAWWFFLFYFLFAYVVRRGALDGRPGLEHAVFKAWYFREIAMRIRDHAVGTVATATPCAAKPAHSRSSTRYADERSAHFLGRCAVGACAVAGLAVSGARRCRSRHAVRTAGRGRAGEWRGFPCHASVSL